VNFLNISRTSGFFSIKPSKKIQKTTKLQTYISPWNDLSGINDYNHIHQIQSKIQKKMSGFIKIIRVENILPTVLLSVSSGFIMMPNLFYLMESTTFIVSIITTLLIMTNSMIINDIFDMEIDKINAPARPLITGELTKNEAVGISLFFTVISELLSIRFLNRTSQNVVHIANLIIILYTPVFKRVLFLKNLVCSGLISFSTVFPTLCFGNTNGNFRLLMVLGSMILFGSISVESLYDIKDADGDLKNDINTIPTKYGKQFTYRFIRNILMTSILSNTMFLAHMYNVKYGLLFFILQSPLLIRLREIKNSYFDEKTIKKYGLKTTETLAITLIFLCFLATR
jgi:geranylgeranylglycerol-phosphate geranylgeranyltransferase